MEGKHQNHSSPGFCSVSTRDLPHTVIQGMMTVSPVLLTWMGWGSVSSSPQIIVRGWPNRAILAPESNCPREFPLAELRLRVNDCGITFFLFFVPSAASKRKAKTSIKKTQNKTESAMWLCMLLHVYVISSVCSAEMYVKTTQTKMGETERQLSGY